MEEDTVVGLPRPGRAVEGDPLLPVLREGARYRRWGPAAPSSDTGSALQADPLPKARDGLMR
jgi:hypothetical protein